MAKAEKAKHWTFYVDMDGVVADLMSSVIDLLYGESAVKPLLRGWPKGTYDMGDALGKPESEIWTAINREGAELWRDLATYGWATPMINQLHDLGDVLFLSSPSREPQSATGKLQWIAQHFSMMARDVILAPSEHKWRVASPTGILIDDSQDNIDDWIEHGGKGIIVPQPWNDAEEPDDGNKLDYIMKRVHEAIGRPEKASEE